MVVLDEIGLFLCLKDYNECSKNGSTMRSANGLHDTPDVVDMIYAIYIMGCKSESLPNPNRAHRHHRFVYSASTPRKEYQHGQQAAARGTQLLFVD